MEQDQMDEDDGDDFVPPPPPVSETVGPSWFNTAKPRFEPIKVHFAINNGDLPSVQKYVTCGYDLNYIIHGNTPLTLAIIKDQFEIAHLLVDSGCDVNIPENTKWKRMPIHLAACVGETSLVQKIVEHGCFVDATDTTDLTALHWAASQGHQETTRYLLDAGASVHLKDDAGRTSLHRAAENGHCDVLCQLHAAGANINEQDKRGWSVLFQAAACNDLKLVESLIQFGIDVNLEDNNQETALHIIANRLRGKNILVLCRTDVNIYTRHLAVFNAAVQRAQQSLGNEVPITGLFIDNGVDVNRKNLWGETAAYIAAEEGYGAIIMLLFEAGATISFESWAQESNLPENLRQNPEFEDWFKTTALHFVTLQHLCKYVIRLAIRRNINQNVNFLPLPQKLRDFLKVKL